MGGRRVRGAVAVLCVLALGAGAGSLAAAPWADEGASGGFGDGDPIPVPETGQPPAGDSADGGAGPGSLLTVLITGGLLALVAVGLIGLALTGRSRIGALPALALLVVAWAGVYSLAIGAPGAFGVVTDTANGTVPASDTTAASDGLDPMALAMWLYNGAVLAGIGVSVLLAIASVGVVLFGVRSFGSQAETETRSPEEPEAVAAAAGRAAEALESGDAPAENRVYEAWREMTGVLTVRTPETSTPGEFATAAVAAGMDREDVGVITELFEEVRYGAADPSQEREQRAIAALRRIEERYDRENATGDRRRTVREGKG